MVFDIDLSGSVFTWVELIELSDVGFRSLSAKYPFA